LLVVVVVDRLLDGDPHAAPAPPERLPVGDLDELAVRLRLVELALPPLRERPLGELVPEFLPGLVEQLVDLVIGVPRPRPAPGVLAAAGRTPAAERLKAGGDERGVPVLVALLDRRQ